MCKFYVTLNSDLRIRATELSVTYFRVNMYKEWGAKDSG